MNVQTSTSNARSPFRRKMVSPFDPTDLGASPDEARIRFGCSVTFPSWPPHLGGGGKGSVFPSSAQVATSTRAWPRRYRAIRTPRDSSHNLDYGCGT